MHGHGHTVTDTVTGTDTDSSCCRARQPARAGAGEGAGADLLRLGEVTHVVDADVAVRRAHHDAVCAHLPATPHTSQAHTPGDMHNPGL